jgi:hypothetical protein
VRLTVPIPLSSIHRHPSLNLLRWPTRLLKRMKMRASLRFNNLLHNKTAIKMIIVNFISRKMKGMKKNMMMRKK